MEGRARDQRHHGRRGPPAPPLPRHPRAGGGRERRPGGSGPTSSQTAPGTPSTAGRPICRPPSRPTWRCAWPATSRPTPAPASRRRAGCEASGGIEASRVFTRIWLALVGRWDWEDLPVLPPEIMFLPPWAPLNIYDFGCWARQTVVALTVVMAHRPARPLPFTVDELRVPRAGAPGPAAASPPQPARPRRQLPARSAHHRRAVPRPRPAPAPLRTTAPLVPPPPPPPPGCAAPGRAVDRPAPGSRRALGRHPAPGRLFDHRPAPAGLPARPPGAGRRPGTDSRTSSSTTTGAGASKRASRPCGTPPWPWWPSPTPASSRTIPPWPAAAGWLLARGGHGHRRLGRAPARPGTRRVGVRVRQRQLPRHRRHRRSGAGPAPGRHRSRPGRRTPPARRGVAWTAGMQSRDGGWGAFDADNDSNLVAALPFCDFGEVTDPPSADVTAHVIEMLAAGARRANRRARPRHRLAVRPAGARRLLVRALGRQLRVRDRRRRPGADRRRRSRR